MYFWGIPSKLSDEMINEDSNDNINFRNYKILEYEDEFFMYCCYYEIDKEVGIAQE